MAQESKPLDSLEERLMDHAKSFDGLLSLIPADVYFGKDNSDQWQRKKQTKEQKQAAKRAKLDPDNAKTAKDVFDERAANERKRKREEEGEVDSQQPQAAASNETLSNSSKTEKQSKKQKSKEGDVSLANPKEIGESKKLDEERRRIANAAKYREKKERKKAKVEKKAAKVEARRKRKEQENAVEEDSRAAAFVRDSGSPPRNDDEDMEEGKEKDGSDQGGNDIEPIEMDSGFADEDLAVSASTASPSPTNLENSPNIHSGSSSVSSIRPPPTDKDTSLPKVDIANTTSTIKTTKFERKESKSSPEELKARLAARIEALRTARKASDPNKAPTNRQELMEQRRKKEEERKAHKKELRRKAKEEEQAKRADTLARGSPLLSNTNSPLLSPGSPAASSENNNFSFGRISFPSGQRASASLNAILTPGSKQKGPSDPHTALQAAEKRLSRLAALDPEKQADIAEKDVWLNAKKRAHGERIRDDTSLLKKTLKRKEKQKKKSEKEWTERIEGVKKGQAMKQKKREANIQKRKDEKGTKGGKGGKPKGKAGKKARPGFEGSFKAKAPSAGGDKPRRR